jgi:hypothetical protein
VAITAASKNSVTDQGLESTCSPIWTFANIFFLSRKKKKKKAVLAANFENQGFCQPRTGLEKGPWRLSLCSWPWAGLDYLVNFSGRSWLSVCRMPRNM